MEAKATSLPIFLSVYACFEGYEVYTYNLKQSQESLQGAVEVDFCIHPAHAQGLVTLILILDLSLLPHVGIIMMQLVP